MNALRYSLKQLLTAHRDRKFVVPNYQREYEWETPSEGKGEVGQFWDDIWHNSWRAGRKHFLGVILVDERGPNSELVDGQQRVTTVFLLLLALRDLLKSRGLPTFNPERWPKCAAGTALRLVLQDGPCRDFDFINALYSETSSQFDATSLSESKIIRAYRYFKTELDSHLEGGSDLTEFLDRTFDKAEVLLLSVEPDDRPAAIFETLNSRGRQVSPTDLVRNLFNYARDVDTKAVELARQVWSYVTKLFDEDDLKQFLSVFVLRDGNQTPGGGLYEELRFEFVQAQEARELASWLKGFERSALHYQRILEPAEDSRINHLLLELKQLSVPSLAPLLMVVLDCVDDLDRLEQILRTLRSLVVRTAVVYERPSTKFQQLAVEAGNCFDPMHQVNRAEALQKLEDLLREFWIKDDRFVDRFMLRPLFGPGVHIRRLRYYLQELETAYSQAPLADEALAKSVSDLRFNADNSSIDHVMPDNLSEIWHQDLEEKNPDQIQVQHESLGDTIGNLTVLLIPDNSKIKNLAFSEKKQVYLNPDATLPKFGVRRRHPISVCALNDYFRNHEKWGFSDILERGRVLANVARFDMETRYRHPVTLALAEKVFGPSINGKGAPGNTLSAIATSGNKGKTYIGVPGIEPGAIFYIQFPREIDFGRLPPTPGKPGTPDHIRGLRKDGPFAGQNRESEIKKWEEDQKEQERFAAALPEIAKRAEVSGELHLPGIGKLKVRVKVLSGRGSKVVCEPLL